jgi:serine protease AprX
VERLSKHFIKGSLVAALLIATAASAIQGASLSQALASRLALLGDNADAGMVIVAFQHEQRPSGKPFECASKRWRHRRIHLPTLGMVAQPMTIGQVRTLSTNPAVRSIWSNDRMTYYMHQARVVGGVQKIQSDAAMTVRNGGMPVSGAGDFSILVIDSGVDCDAQRSAVRAKGHPERSNACSSGDASGIHTARFDRERAEYRSNRRARDPLCGNNRRTGLRSGGLYTGVAPGSKIIGAGLGAGLFVVNGLAAWEWGLANQ